MGFAVQGGLGLAAMAHANSMQYFNLGVSGLGGYQSIVKLDRKQREFVWAWYKVGLAHVGA